MDGVMTLYCVRLPNVEPTEYIITITRSQYFALRGKRDEKRTVTTPTLPFSNARYVSLDADGAPSCTCMREVLGLLGYIGFGCPSQSPSPFLFLSFYFFLVDVLIRSEIHPSRLRSSQLARKQRQRQRRETRSRWTGVKKYGITYHYQTRAAKQRDVVFAVVRYVHRAQQRTDPSQQPSNPAPKRPRIVLLGEPKG
ncbi:hypothetical protein GALMADRAFT_255337 [Galerina marginata CBS 339.88]|uniref:Uncharacterized protein n=1 Tax=Galerina marginata (strain CBS 339.88) TaxID=685588 RepID=A0A067STD2_GALM3|nr:hypothetical protein GALMADRAFT_255337 [Galerina marginata CBS 339.88]